MNKLVKENNSFCPGKSGKSQGKWILQSSRNHGAITWIIICWNCFWNCFMKVIWFSALSFSVVVLGLGPWPWPVLEDKFWVLGLGLEGQVLGLGLGLEGQGLGLGLGLEQKSLALTNQVLGLARLVFQETNTATMLKAFSSHEWLDSGSLLTQ